MNSARTSPRSNSVGGSANGLPDYIAGSRLFPNAGGSFQAQRAGVESSEQQRATSALGVVMTPDMTLEQAIALASDQKGAGGRIFVSEGVWDFGANGSLISVDGLEIIALSPGKTIFRRVLGSSAATITTIGAYTVRYGILNVESDRVTVRGVTFVDSTGSAEAVLVKTAGYFSAIGCVFSDVSTGIMVISSAHARVANNTFTSVRATDAFLSLSTCSCLSIAENMGDGNITLTSGTTLSSIVGNVLDSSMRITFVGGNAANFATGNNAPVNEEGAYTLADNTAVAADVSGFPTWDVTVYRSVHMRYQISRDAAPNIETGELVLVMNSAECLAYVDAVTTTVAPGVSLVGAVSGGTAKLQYTTTATGAAATLLIISVNYGGA